MQLKLKNESFWQLETAAKKKTFNNALIGAPKNKTFDGTTGGKQDFSMHNSIIPELTDTIIIEISALNDS